MDSMSQSSHAIYCALCCSPLLEFAPLAYSSRLPAGNRSPCLYGPQLTALSVSHPGHSVVSLWKSVILSPLQLMQNVILLTAICPSIALKTVPVALVHIAKSCTDPLRHPFRSPTHCIGPWDTASDPHAPYIGTSHMHCTSHNIMFD